ncbi:hypothetical protein E1218_26055 [Kribbella turkmenica]|uniref:DUF4352 domain-containing protein n=1 Tax=Kribbella turkmenica TaxID=2530375 RepID=A0A4R4WH36_9ACTN|nr:hypothetical protein [Kribbella turkmenica]TDD18458.1 hypothetical protein E1218_26055 [Kribbella turkmenica]
MESLDDVIDAMIADRVIHRHRRKWLIAIALVVVLALVILVAGGWKEKVGRTVPTLTAPATVEAGKWEYTVTKAEIRVRKAGEYTDAETELRVYFDLKNIDEEEKTSDSLRQQLLVFVPGGGQEHVQSNGADCHGELNWVLVYGLPPESCFTTFEVPADFTSDLVEIGILGERYVSDSAVLGANDEPYWQAERPDAVVQLKPEVVDVTGEDR